MLGSDELGVLSRIMQPGDKGRYFREISAAFLQLRGAPFILSARELHVLAAWEKEGIPLNAVLEGMENAFQSLRARPAPERRRISLQFCDPFVQRVFGQVQERRAGGRRRGSRREVKKEKIRQAIRIFLATSPAELAFLRELYERALRSVEAQGDREEDLESLEIEIEEALAAHCPTDEWEKAQRQARRDVIAPKDNMNSLVRRRAIKNFRERYGIPYVSFPFY